jgi:two-component system NarL family sensor kinase
MSAEVDYGTVVDPPEASRRIRTGFAWTYLAMATSTCLLVGALLVARADAERDAIEHRALHEAAALSTAFDQEVASVNHLLQGLAKSPALLAGDLKGLYDQFRATTVPEGSWLLFQDLVRQLVNSALPFGTQLPRHTVVPNHQALLDRIRTRGWTVSGRIIGPATGKTIVALNLRVDGTDGEMTHFLTTILSEVRLRAILDDQVMSSTSAKGLYDRNLQPIVTSGGSPDGPDVPPPDGLASRLARLPADSTAEGTFEVRNGISEPIFVTYRRSQATNWTTLVQTPLAIAEAPLSSALLQIAWLAGFLTLAGGLAVIVTARRVEQPLQTLSDRLSSSTRQVSELSGQLLALQEEERRRIARELHDSTAQHIVAASLGLAGLSEQIKANAEASRSLAEVEGQLDEALKELRIFTYLLHPPDLAKNGLQATLRHFIEGFAARTGLSRTIRVPEEIDGICPHIQWSVLRVVQEAMANVHRHANASHVSVRARVTATRLVVQVRDDGHGMERSPGPADVPIRFGVGIPGMRARLKQFGGDLRIRTGRGGTIVVANVPLPSHRRRVSRITRLAHS